MARWLVFLVGWLVGSFFGVQSIMGMVRGIGKQPGA